MKFPFAKIFRSYSKSIPEKVKNQLGLNFPNAKNIDWEVKGNEYEAVFYLDEIEHIAQFSDKGDLIEYKKNLWLDELPVIVKNSGSTYGEIMNGIVITRNTNLFYELIIRDSQLDRYVYLFDDKGLLIESHLL